MGRIRTVTADWSDAAKRILAECAAAGNTADYATERIATEAGDEVAERTVSRRLAELRQAAAVRTAARERMSILIEAFQAGNATASTSIQALAMRALELEPDGLAGADPVKLQRLALQGEELRLKKSAMDIKARQVGLDEQRLALLVEREKRAIAVLEEGKGEAITAEERLARARALYGL
jgi:hypothetical protein